MSSLEKAKLHYSINGKYEEYQKAIEYIIQQSCLISRINSRIEIVDMFSEVLGDIPHRKTILLMCLDRVSERINNKFKYIKSYE